MKMVVVVVVVVGSGDVVVLKAGERSLNMFYHRCFFSESLPSACILVTESKKKVNMTARC